MKELKVQEYKRFEDIKHVRAAGSEYWSARELAVALGQTYFAIGICKIVFVKHHLWSTIKP